MDGVIAVAAVWGFAEATVFFIVPDVWLTIVAVTSPQRALPASVAAVIGAVAGGVVMRRWGRRNPMAARHSISAVPGIHPAMVERVEHDVRVHGLRAMVVGPLLGVPYKIYAVTVGPSRARTAMFLLVSVVARMPRLILLTAVAYGLSRWVFSSLSWMVRSAIVAGIWAAFYLWYFRAMSRQWQ
jgi:membrane protein DedA with SNARE-associated domain